jgi:hypothetical protein
MHNHNTVSTESQMLMTGFKTRGRYGVPEERLTSSLTSPTLTTGCPVPGEASLATARRGLSLALDACAEGALVRTWRWWFGVAAGVPTVRNPSTMPTNVPSSTGSVANVPAEGEPSVRGPGTLE